jgi:hypothetical protein
VNEYVVEFMLGMRSYESTVEAASTDEARSIIEDAHYNEGLAIRFVYPASQEGG